MIELTPAQAPLVKKLFDYTEETFIRSFVQGHMGRGWADELSNPSCAQILVGDVCFFAGNHKSGEAQSLVKNIPANFKSPSLLMIPQNESWGRLIAACYGGHFKKYPRYAIKKENGCFGRDTLAAFVNMLPGQYRLARIDEQLYHQSFTEDFSKDFCSQFNSAQDYIARGLGYCVLLGSEMVCGASSYTVYGEGIEIEIGTKEDYRRQGLATACAAKLILECLSRGLYPSWDAANKESLALAQKLGYQFDYEYDTYEIDCTKLKR